jgi:ribosomal protein S12 methylthiotransferase accessory factor
MKNNPMRSKIIDLLKAVEQGNIVEDLVRIFNYPDEPQLFRYSATIGNIDKYSDGNKEESTASGFSFESSELALLKCLVEVIERFATLRYRLSEFNYSRFQDLHESAIDPALFTGLKSHQKNILAWVTGFDLLLEKKVLIPAQTVFYNYKVKKPEPLLTSQVSTGAAGGLDHAGTLLRAIYEIVERDAFMGVYLAKIKAPRINPESLPIPELDIIMKRIKRYKLEVYLIDISSDLRIPTILSVIVDRTGLGPSVSVGLKSSLSKEKAVIGSLEESLLTRPWMRNEIITQGKNEFNIKKDSLYRLKERGLFWISPKMIKHLRFLIDQPSVPAEFNIFEKDVVSELEIVKQILTKHRIKTYYADISPQQFKHLGISVFKVIIPQLQPLFFQESSPEIRTLRINQIAHYYNKKKIVLNKIPHPFL